MKNQNLMRLLVFLFLGTAFLQSCKKDDDNNDVFQDKGVFVLNEGGFSQGNSSVTFYDTEKDSLTQDLFFTANNLPLGDVAFDFVIDGETAYITVNNSGKVEVVDVKTFVSKATITGFNSPRYFLKVAADKAYVTDLFNNGIYIVNLSSNTITGQIAVTGWTEGMVIANNKVYVSNPDGNKVLMIDPATDAIVGDATVPNGASSIAKDKNGNLWVLCTGNYQDSLPRHIVQIDPAGQILKSLEIPDINAFLADMLISEDGMSVYYIYNDVFKISITDDQIPSTPFIAQGTRSIYSLGWEPGTTNLYVGDAGDYTNPGNALIYNATSGAMIKSFQAGISPGAFAFLQ